MSDALDYLMQVRPEAMQAYFGFVRASGRHLDRRTRAIISVITKVERQTEAGFRQYLRRALDEGVSANEILDALLVAFPSLGLSRIVWAVDQLLALDLPDFRAEQLLPDAGAWRDVAALSDLSGRRVTRLSVEGRGLFVFNDGELRVYDSRCPHQGTDMTIDAVIGDSLRCPRHGWQFDLAGGACLAGGDRPLRRLEHRLEHGRLQVRWPAGS